MIPDYNERRRYLCWLGCLMRIREACQAVEEATTDSARAKARGELGLATFAMDLITLPDRWRSWQHLGEAIALAPKKAPAIGEERVH